MKKIRARLDSFRETHPGLWHILSTEPLRTGAGLALAGSISLLLTLFCIVSGLAHDARWFITLGLYNLVILLVRLVIAFKLRSSLRHPRTGAEAARWEARICLNTGLVLLFINLVFIGIMAETIIRGNTMRYPLLLLFFLCLFFLVRFVFYLIHALRSRQEGPTLHHAIHVVNMTIALCSLYTAQVSVLDQFCQDELLRLVLNLITSAVIFYFMLRLAVNTVLKARDALRS